MTKDCETALVLLHLSKAALSDVSPLNSPRLLARSDNQVLRDESGSMVRILLFDYVSTTLIRLINNYCRARMRMKLTAVRIFK